ncbi:MAG: glycosyl hydrolase family protein [Bacteroidales bacterium]|nr:glycosyl hydrolase family protein [Bacteroidales bacterium]
MKKIKLFSLLCLGLMLGSTSCSKDNDDDNDNQNNNKVVNNPTDEDDKEETAKYRYFGAELFSNETFTYGKFEAKMKMAYAPGCISSMFLYYNDSYKGNGEIWNEIDIEVIGKEPNGFQSNIITGKKESQVTTEKIHKIDSPVADNFHIYTVEWTPDYVAWFLDGKEIRRSDASNDTKKQVAALVKPQSLRFNIWSSASTAWVGTLSQKYIPITQEIDYIKVYDYNEDGTFTEKWTDDFDSFNSSRWGRGNWQMENVIERPNNVVVEDGILKLKLTKELK